MKEKILIIQSGPFIIKDFDAAACQGDANINKLQQYIVFLYFVCKFLKLIK